MSEFSYFNFTTLLLLGFVGAIAGYTLRRLEKFEENSDNFRALALTQISASGDLLLQCIERFTSNNITKESFVEILASIEATLKSQVFDQGNISLLDDEKRSRITNLYYDILLISKDAKNYSEDSLKTKLNQEGQVIGGTTIKAVKATIAQVKLDLNNELKYYRFKFPVFMIALVGILGIFSAIVTYIQGLITGT